MCNTVLTRDHVEHGSSTHSTSGCIMQPAATFVNYVYTLKFTQQFRWLDIPLIFPSTAAHKLAHNNSCVALYHKKVGGLWFTAWSLGKCRSWNRRENTHLFIYLFKSPKTTTHTHTHIYTYTYIHTHTHTYLQIGSNSPVLKHGISKREHTHLQIFQKWNQSWQKFLFPLCFKHGTEIWVRKWVWMQHASIFQLEWKYVSQRKHHLNIHAQHTHAHYILFW
jgi:hypothetical protein